MARRDLDTLTPSERRLVARQLAGNPGVLGPPQAVRLARLMADGARLPDACGRAHVGSVAFGRKLMAHALVSAGAAQPRPSRPSRRSPRPARRPARTRPPARSADARAASARPPDGGDGVPGGAGSDPSGAC